jgi:hypothetical protein
MEADSKGERELARADYIRHVRLNREIGSAPESFERYLAEWLSVRKVKLDAGEEVNQYEPRRDYSQLYRSGEK